MENVIATISIQKLTSTNKYEYVTMATGVRLLISPASATILALYPDVPIGQTFNYMVINDNSFALVESEFKIPPQSKITITTSYENSIKASEIYITKETPQRKEVGGQDVFVGVCVKN